MLITFIIITIATILVYVIRYTLWKDKIPENIARERWSIAVLYASIFFWITAAIQPGWHVVLYAILGFTVANTLKNPEKQVLSEGHYGEVGWINAGVYKVYKTMDFKSDVIVDHMPGKVFPIKLRESQLIDGISWSKVILVSGQNGYVPGQIQWIRIRFHLSSLIWHGMVSAFSFAFGIGVLKGVGYYLLFREKVKDFNKDLIEPAFYLFKLGLAFGAPIGFFLYTFKFFKDNFSLSESYSKYPITRLYIFISSILSVVWTFLGVLILSPTDSSEIISNISFGYLLILGIVSIVLGWHGARFILSNKIN